MNPEPICDLHPLEYQHPFDSAALEGLRGTPGLELFTKQFLKYGLEKFFVIQYTGSNLKVSESNYPDLIAIVDSVCATLCLSTIPHIYIEWDDSINSRTIGDEHPIIVLSSGAIDRLTDEELRFLIGHECGHIKSKHVLYQMMAETISSLSSVIGQFTIGLGKLISQPLQLALMHWSRTSELSCDRAGLLACQNVNTAVAVMIKLAGLPEKYQQNINRAAFVQQAKEFEDFDFDKLSRIIKFAINMGRNQPWTILRSAELLKWVDAGEYEQILLRQSTRKAKIRSLGHVEFCRHCNFRLHGGELFCPNCGSELR